MADEVTNMVVNMEFDKVAGMEVDKCRSSQAPKPTRRAAILKSGYGRPRLDFQCFIFLCHNIFINQVS